MSLLDRAHALTVLTRLAVRRPGQRERLRDALAGRLDELAPTAMHVAVETGDPIGAILADLLQDRLFPGLLEELERKLPTRSTALRELALLLVRRRYETEIYQKPLHSGRDVLHAVSTLSLYATRLADVGQLQLSINANIAANKFLEDGGMDDDTTAHIRGVILHNIADAISDLGDHESALPVAEKAIRCYVVAARRGESPVYALAGAMNGAATIQISMQDFENAQCLLEEARDLLIKSGEHSADARLITARIGNNLALVRAQLGDKAAALRDYDAAVEQARQLAEARPDEMRPFLARYLVGRSIIQLDLCNQEAARRDVAEGLAIWEDLSAERPDAFNNDYLLALEAEARVATANGGTSSSAPAEQMAEQLRRAQREPGRWRLWWSRLARHLLREAGDADWERMAEKSDEVLAQLALSEPVSEADADSEAELLLVNGIAHRHCGRTVRSVASAERAIALLDAHSGQVADARRVQARQSLAGYLADEGRIDEAAAVFRLVFDSFATAHAPEKLATAAHIAFETIHDKAPRIATTLLDEAERMMAWISTHG